MHSTINTATWRRNGRNVGSTVNSGLHIRCRTFLQLCHTTLVNRAKLVGVPSPDPSPALAQTLAAAAAAAAATAAAAVAAAGPTSQ